MDTKKRYGISARGWNSNRSTYAESRPSRNPGIHHRAAALQSSGLAAEGAQTPRTARQITFNKISAGPPQSVSAAANAALTENPLKQQVLSEYWVQLVDADHASAAPGDHLVIQLNPNEAVELVVTTVNIHDNGITTWFASISEHAATAFNGSFSSGGVRGKPVTFVGGALQLPDGRQFSVNASSELPGWALLRELKPGTGTHGDFTGDTGTEVTRQRMIEERERRSPPENN